jgi:hypothetical protein
MGFIILEMSCQKSKALCVKQRGDSPDLQACKRCCVVRSGEIKMFRLKKRGLHVAGKKPLCVMDFFLTG